MVSFLCWFIIFDLYWGIIDKNIQGTKGNDYVYGVMGVILSNDYDYVYGVKGVILSNGYVYGVMSIILVMTVYSV